MERIASLAAGPVAPTTHPLFLAHSAKPVTLPGRPLTQFELNSYADFLACELGFSRVAACDRMTSWYQEQIGADICTESDAGVLRILVMIRCRDRGVRQDAASVIRQARESRELIGTPEIVSYPQPADLAPRTLFCLLPGRMDAGVDMHWHDERRSARNLIRIMVGVLVAEVLGSAALVSWLAVRY